MTSLDTVLKTTNITLVTKVCRVKSMVFPVVMYGMWVLDHEEGWAPKNWCFWIVGLEKTVESLLDCKEITSVNPKGNQHWLFIGSFDTEAEAPILWPLDAKSLLIEKDWSWEKLKAKKKGTTENEMVGWHLQLNGHEFEQTLGDGEDREAWWATQSMGSQRAGHKFVTEQHSILSF